MLAVTLDAVRDVNVTTANVPKLRSNDCTLSPGFLTPGPNNCKVVHALVYEPAVASPAEKSQ